jgi:hypothetical protein
VVGGRGMQIDHLHRRELFDGAAWRQAGGQGAQATAEGDVQAVARKVMKICASMRAGPW